MARSFPSQHLAAAALLLTTLAAPPPATGQELEDHLGQTVHGVEIEGVADDLAKRIKAGLALATRTGLLRTGRPILGRDVHDQDVYRIRLFLARSGYPFAEISSRFEGARRSRIRVVFVIDPGPPVRYGRVEVTGEPDVLRDAEERADDLLATGDRFDDAAVQRTQAFLEAALAEAGFAQGTVETRISPVDSVTVDVDFVIDPGEPFLIETLSVTGVEDDLRAVALRTMDVAPGTAYSPLVLQEARQNLQNLGLFRQIRLETKETGPRTLELTVDLRHANPRTISLSVGSWTDDILRFQARWTHRNLLRRGRGVEVLGMYTQWRRELSGRTWWPGLLSARSVAELEVGAVVEDEESYYLTGAGVGVSNSVRSTARRSWRVGVDFTDVDFEARSDNLEEFLANPGRQIILNSRWHADRSDDLIDPVTGSRLTLDGHFSSPGLSESPFVSAEANVVRYLPHSGKHDPRDPVQPRRGQTAGRRDRSLAELPVLRRRSELHARLRAPKARTRGRRREAHRRRGPLSGER